MGASPCLSSLSAGRAPSAAALARPFSSPRPDLVAAGLPTHPGVGVPAAAGGGEEEVRRCGVREGEEKGGRARMWGPTASDSEEGHQLSWPLSRPPLPRPCTGDGPDPGCHLGGTSIHKLDLDPVCASSPPATPPPLSELSLWTGSFLPTWENSGSPGEIRAALSPGKL